VSPTLDILTNPAFAVLGQTYRASLPIAWPEALAAEVLHAVVRRINFSAK
jgi:hypothetical protein